MVPFHSIWTEKGLKNSKIFIFLCYYTIRIFNFPNEAKINVTLKSIYISFSFKFNDKMYTEFYILLTFSS